MSVLTRYGTSFESSVGEAELLLLVHQVGIALQGMSCVYPQGKVRAIELTELSLAHLDKGQMLNDDIVDMFAR